MIKMVDGELALISKGLIISYNKQTKGILFAPEISLHSDAVIEPYIYQFAHNIERRDMIPGDIYRVDGHLGIYAEYLNNVILCLSDEEFGYYTVPIGDNSIITSLELIRLNGGSNV
jgi:hypothetical protein